MPHSVDIYVGQRLRLRRSMLGMSQEQLGNSTGITFQQVQKYERGINRMGASRLYDFSKILSTPISYFFEGFTDTNKSSVAESASPAYEVEAMTGKDTMALVRAFSEIKSPKVRRQVLQLARSLAGKEIQE
jgi:transcriptional regulator with XRE-family HTH domain